jgi:transcriptional regulator with XRE-family HTH domain
MAINQLELDRHQELAEFLRSRRARLSPEQAGLSRGVRRRTPGLRREEVASLAGVSPEWYTWLEQGRDINVSVQLLESLARVLQLDDNERTYLLDNIQNKRDSVLHRFVPLEVKCCHLLFKKRPLAANINSVDYLNEHIENLHLLHVDRRTYEKTSPKNHLASSMTRLWQLAPRRQGFDQTVL